MGWIQTVLALLQLTPSILQLILQVEQVFGAGQGPAKKAVIMNVVKPLAPAGITAHVSTLIDNQVTALKTAGKLPKSAKP